MRNNVAPSLFLVLLSIVPSASALEPAAASQAYSDMQAWQFSPAVLLTAPVTITRGTATWTLSSGTIKRSKPLPDGRSTGIVFEGKGRFTMTIPDRFELAQLRRYAKRKDLEQIEQPIKQLVLRTTDHSLMDLFPAAGGNHTADALATKRHEAWLIDHGNDNDARLIAALLRPGAEFTVIDANTDDFGWLVWEYDSTRGEEVSLTRYDLIPERWISLDARPPNLTVPPVVLTHIDGKADLTRRGSLGEVGRNHQRTVNGKYTIETTLTGATDSIGALVFELMPTAREVKAFEGDKPLTLFRDHIGKRSRMVDNRLHDDDLVVVLDPPLTRGEQRKIRFEYELESANFVPSRAWYPTPSDSFEQKHTARLELTVHRKNELRSMGKMENRREEDDRETSVWIVSEPVKMLTFSTATRFEEVKVEVAGIPQVVAFGPDYQLGNTGKIRNVAADVANALQYFSNLLGVPIAGEQFYATSIAAGHGQAFDGFLHMTEYTFSVEHPGASELFRAHEVAHNWFGHKVGWTTYRDQWISEAFAEYIAMEFVRDTVKGGDKYYDEMLRSYTGIVMGNMAGGFSKFNRPWLIERNTAQRNRLGPIGHGWRASTGETPFGYVTQTYYKGPLVLHMLRQLMTFKSGSDEIFFKTLRDFVREHNGKTASTEDFRRIVERNTNADWGWFFDAWIYSADIPSYNWRHDVKPAEGGGYLVTVEVERRDVPEWFTVVIPVRVDLEGGKSGYFYIPSKPGKQIVTQKLPVKPRNVVFAPDFSLLANIRRD